MGDVISIGKKRLEKAEQEREKVAKQERVYELTKKRSIDNQELDERLTRMRASLERINKLICELRTEE